MRGDDWSRPEVEATVSDYLEMLLLELRGVKFSKAEHRRRLVQKLSGRSMGAIEFKHQNISAVLAEIHFPSIIGYKPSGNYQNLLYDVVVQQLESNSLIQNAAKASVEALDAKISTFMLESALVPAPVSRNEVRQPALKQPYIRRGVHRDYLQIEAHNAAIGLAGELFVAEFESKRLHAAGKPQLAKRVEHVATTRGDGLGHDVLSFEVDGREKYVEVKTTKFGALTPIFVSDSEVRFSQEKNELYVLARVHEMRTSPKFFELRGPLDKTMHLEAIAFSGKVLS